MAKLDEVKEFIGFLKAIFIVLVVIDTSMIAYLYKETDSALASIIVVITILIISIIIILLFNKILKEIKKLRDL